MKANPDWTEIIPFAAEELNAAVKALDTEEPIELEHDEVMRLVRLAEAARAFLASWGRYPESELRLNSSFPVDH